MTTLNVDLLDKVKKHILAEPARLRMDNWLRQGNPGQTLYCSSSGYGEPNEYKLPACGTAGCIAGWTAVLGYPDDPLQWVLPATTAIKILGIKEMIQPYNLFFPDQWPSSFYEDYQDAESQEERAQIVCDVIDHFVKVYQGNELNYHDNRAEASLDDDDKDNED